MADVEQVLWHPSAWSALGSAYGISGNADQVVVYRAQRGGNGQALYSGPMDSENAAWRKILQDMRAEQGGGEAWVAAGLPAEHCILKWLKTPLKNKSKARRVLPGLLDLEIPFKLEDFRYFFLQLRANSAGAYEALAAAARLKELRGRQEALGAASIEVDLIDAEALSLWQGVRSQLGAEPQLVLDIAEARSLLLVADERSLHFQLVIASGANDIQNGDKEAFSKSMQRGLHALPAEYQKHGALLLTGLTLKGAVSDLLTQTFDPERSFSEVAEGEFCIARGLAERALQCSETSLNFLLAGESPRLLGTAQKTMRKWAVVLALSGVAFLTGAQLWQRSADARIAEYQQEITSLAADLAGQTPAQMKAYRGQEVLIATRAMEDRGLSSSAFERALSKGLIPPLSALLETAAQHELDIQHLRLSAQSLLVEGSALDWDICENLLAEGQRQGYTLQLSRDRADRRERVPFRLYSKGEER